DAGAGLDHARIDHEARGVDDLGARGDGDVRSDGGDLAAADHDGAVRDVGAADGDDMAAADGEGPLRAGVRVVRAELRAGGDRQRGEHGHQGGDVSEESHHGSRIDRLDRWGAPSHGTTGEVRRPGRSAASSAMRSLAIRSRIAWSRCTSKKISPSMNVVCAVEYTLNGSPVQITTSASLPTSIDPTLSWMPSCSAPL